MHQQLQGYKDDEKINLGVRERKKLNITGVTNAISYSCLFVTLCYRVSVFMKLTVSHPSFCQGMARHVCLIYQIALCACV